MFQLLSIQIITSLLLFSSLSYSQYNALSRGFRLYEQECDNPRKDFSKRVLDSGLHYCTEDQNPYLDGCQLVKPSAYNDPAFDICLPEDVHRISSNTLYLGTNPYIFESCFLQALF